MQARQEWVHAMTDQLAHRGPDGSGSLLLEDVALGHRRLSIIDLSHSIQPMSTSEGRFHLTYNGEIFNYKELRAVLEKDGATFRTAGDTEVLLQVLRYWGPAGLHKLNGQFAFAFYDESQHELMVCRDRMGILPLFYHFDGRRFSFASEIKALLALPWIDAELNPDAVERYLATRSTRAPQTLFRGIHKLEPGTHLILSASGELKKTQWWCLPGPVSNVSGPQEAECLVRDALTSAVKARLVADVPVGAFLSGGLDSSLITALAATINEKPVTCFVAGFGDARFDEVPYAQSVAEHYGLELEVVLLDPGAFISSYEKLTWNRDAPLSEPGDVAVYHIAIQAASRVKVMLSGEGADELFAGYPKHRIDQQLDALQRLPIGLRKYIVPFLERRLAQRASRLRVAVRALSARSRQERWLNWFAPFTWYELEAMREGFGGILDESSDVDSDYLNAMLRNDCGQWLGDNLLERGDRMSMAASIECRPPFMDHNLVELAFQIPSSLKCKRGTGKIVLRNIAKDLLPPQIIERRKIGFKVPIDQWFRGEMREYVWDHLLGTNSFVGEYLSRKVIADIYSRHLSGKNEELKIWTLLGLEIWHRRFLVM
ncbi:MAG: asparagine synthase (glutamine-hydrolyzing) [Candidatus Hydrogenedentes bacterium]|nr:asparagine synthase (glutamine-hydrolyzing) [Candidatus Hydrogenedentota bacterium]